ncbi:hypothetical protein B566_EDAN010034 [Ephemera danica]|nr:hypothetical protein B566_EDAN010034 [Ephemera danica]
MSQQLDQESSSPSEEDLSCSSNESESCCGWNDCCICGYNSDADWDDDNCKQCKKLKFEVPKEKHPHRELHRAIAKHHCRTIRQLLEDGVKPCTTKKSKSCFLLALVRSTFILKKLLEYEPSGVNCQDSKGLTLLMLSKDITTFELLCNYRPDVNLLNNDGNNILFHLLKTHEQFDIWQLQQLVDLGLDVNEVNSKGETSLVFAIKERVDASTIETLFEAGAQLPPPDKDGENIISYAIKDSRVSSKRKIKFLEVLIKNESGPSVKFLEQLVNRGLYNWTASSKLYREENPEETQPISPLTACLSRLCTHKLKNVNIREILYTCKYLISIGVDVTHRTRDKNLSFDVGKCFGDTKELDQERAADFEKLLRLLLPFWSYPPLFLILIRIGEDLGKIAPENLRATTDETLIMRLLIKIGGPVPLGTCYYKSITNYMQKVVVNTAEWQEMLDFVTFRATVKKTCSTGLDFSEYRVLCQGEMVPLPREVVNFLEFRT